MNACRHWRDRLLDYTLGGLPSARVAEIQDHLQGCASCAAAVDELKQKQQQVEAGLAQLIRAAEPSPAFHARVLAAVEEAPQAAGWSPAWKGVVPAVALMALAAIFLPGLADRWQTATDAASAAALSRWRSPTASLLRSPADALLRESPRLGEFYYPLDSAVAGTGEENGGNDDER
jgi:anti-sigma factor RsiW